MKSVLKAVFAQARLVVISWSVVYGGYGEVFAVKTLKDGVEVRSRLCSRQSLDANFGGRKIIIGQMGKICRTRWVSKGDDWGSERGRKRGLLKEDEPERR